jgi:hypothetical protein
MTSAGVDTICSYFWGEPRGQLNAVAGVVLIRCTILAGYKVQRAVPDEAES